MKPYFTDEQLDELSKEYRTLPINGEGQSYEPEYNGIAVRGDIVKLVSDVKTARSELAEAQQTIARQSAALGWYELGKPELARAALGEGTKEQAAPRYRMDREGNLYPIEEGSDKS